jgi:hypothetical protein
MKTIYKGDSRYEKIYEQMQLLGIQDVSSPRQVKNGTVVWRLPILSDKKNTYLEYASFASGYVRNQGVDCHSNWQCNKRIPSDAYYPEYEWKKLDNGDHTQVKTGKYLKWQTRSCELIPNEIDRLEYMLKYVIKNEFIKRANYVQEGKFVPKWKYDMARESEQFSKKRATEYMDKFANVAPEMPDEVTVIINGLKYKVI